MRTSIVLSLLSLMFMMPLASNAASVDTENWRINVNESGEQLQFTIEPISDSYTTPIIVVDPVSQSENSDEATNQDLPTDTEPTAESETADLAEPTLQPGVLGSVLINEFVSDPVSGENEWIELYNSGSSDINMTDWAILEGSGRRTAILDTVVAGGYLTIISPNGSLNNSGDLIELQDSFGNTIDLVSYGSWDASTAPSASDPNSVGRDPNNAFAFVEMSPTQGSQNVYNATVEIALVDTNDATADVAENATPTEESDTPATTDESAETPTVCNSPQANTETDASTGDEAVFVDLANIRTLPLETIVVTEGVISAEPGVLGKQVFYLAGSGVQVYLHSAEFPTLDRGMRVRVTGELRETSGETRIKLSNASDIEILGVSDAPTPHDMTTAEVGEATEGWLVRITGMVAERTSSSFMLEDNLGQARVFIKSTTGIANTVAVGDEVTVTGVVSQTSSGYRVLPRTQDDILPRTETADANADALALGITNSTGSGTMGGWILSSLVALALVAMGTVYALKKKNAWNKKTITA